MTTDDQWKKMTEALWRDRHPVERELKDEIARLRQLIAEKDEALKKMIAYSDGDHIDSWRGCLTQAKAALEKS